jgi:hypothetical protein
MAFGCEAGKQRRLLAAPAHKRSPAQFNGYFCTGLFSPTIGVQRGISILGRLDEQGNLVLLVLQTSPVLVPGTLLENRNEGNLLKTGRVSGREQLRCPQVDI